jgi:halogenation protein CepH
MNAHEPDVIVVGGGPAGSTLGSLLARRGLSVVLLDASPFPRYHIGESLIPQVLDVLEVSGALEQIERHGFLRKEGGVFRWGLSEQPWSFYFDESPTRYKHSYAYQVIRSEFDAVLLDHARQEGVGVVEGTTALGMRREAQHTTVVARGPGGGMQTYVARFVADCSGQRAWLARSRRWRRFDDALRNIALVAYYTGAERLPGRDSHSIFCECVPDGWIWNIPLHDGTNSVGVVLRKPLRTHPHDRAGAFNAALRQSRYIRELLSTGERSPTIRFFADYSYTSRHLVGNGFVIVGDAGNFVDPVWSTGVALATTGALWAADAIERHLGSGAADALLCYQNRVNAMVNAYRRFVHFFYSANAMLESYFWAAYAAIPDAHDPKDAFHRLVAGRLGILPGNH